MNLLLQNIDWQKMDGLIPTIIQDQNTKQILMLGYMNEVALMQTLNTKKVTFFSRSKNTLWVKGETSGNFLELCDIALDCDGDSLLVTAKPIGPTCHKGSDSCFNTVKESVRDMIAYLEQTIAKRRIDASKESYVASLFKAGISRMAQKVGEEGVEVALAAALGDQQSLREESADLFFHLLVLLQAKDISFTEILEVLRQRALSKEKSAA